MLHGLKALSSLWSALRKTRTRTRTPASKRVVVALPAGCLQNSLKPCAVRSFLGLLQIKKRLGKAQLGFAESFLYGAIARALSTVLIYPFKRARVQAQTSESGMNVTSVIVRDLSTGGPKKL